MLTEAGLADLAGMVWSAEIHQARRAFIGGSDMKIIASGDPDAVNQLALIKRGRLEPEDTSESLPAMLGKWTEPFNLAWMQRARPGLTLVANRTTVLDAKRPWMACTPDAYATDEVYGECLIQAKHLNAFAKERDQFADYLPQMHWELGVTRRRWGLISMIRGNTTHVWAPIEFDPFYFSRIRDAAEAFWTAVQEDRDPHYIAPPPPPIAWEEMEAATDMTGNNVWADQAAAWLASSEAAKKFDAAAKELKKVMPPNSKRAEGHGIEIKRDKGGKLRIVAIESQNEEQAA
jgi:hypothetical protein